MCRNLGNSSSSCCQCLLRYAGIAWRVLGLVFYSVNIYETLSLEVSVIRQSYLAVEYMQVKFKRPAYLIWPLSPLYLSPHFPAPLQRTFCKNYLYSLSLLLNPTLSSSNSKASVQTMPLRLLLKIINTSICQNEGSPVSAHLLWSLNNTRFLKYFLYLVFKIPCLLFFILF